MERRFAASAVGEARRRCDDPGRVGRVRGGDMIAVPSAAFGASPVKPAEIDLLWRMQPCAASAPTISRLRRLVRVKRERWRNDGLTAGGMPGPSAMADRRRSWTPRSR